MGMSMFAGKSVRWVSKGDTIGLDTDVIYRDQNRNEAHLNMKIFVEKCKKCKNKTCKRLVEDILSKSLVIGLPIITALNNIAEELGEKEVMEIIK